MGRDAKTVGKLGKKRRWARTTTKPPREPKAKHANSSLTANRDARVARLTRELKEALDRQTATAGILQLIAGSPSDVQPVLDSVCRTAQRLCGAGLAGIAVRRGDVYRYVATSSANPEWDAKPWLCGRLAIPRPRSQTPMTRSGMRERWVKPPR